jgi:hypothetical protein
MGKCRLEGPAGFDPYVGWGLDERFDAVVIA